MLVTALLSQALLATAALAIPSSKDRLAQRVARRANATAIPHGRQSRPKQIVPNTVTTLVRILNSVIGSGEPSHTEFSSNWAGAVLIANTTDPYNFTSVTGNFTIPIPAVPDGAESGTYSASVWVGIDGDTCGSAILQTGVDLTVSGDNYDYNAWYEWFPDFSHDFIGIDFEAGDNVTLTVTATSLTSGNATIINTTTGQNVTHTFADQPELCQKNAEWIVEDFAVGGDLVPFANFTSVNFTSALATMDNGTTVGPREATIIEITQHNELLTEVRTTNDSVAVTYVGTAVSTTV